MGIEKVVEDKGPKKKIRQETIKPKTLTEEFLRNHFDEFILLEREWVGLGNLWDEEKFFSPREGKWELSSYVAQDDRVVGYDIVSKREDTGEEGCLHRIIVDRGYRGRGIGPALFEDMMEKCGAAGLKRITFKVLTDNKPAIAMYKRYGVVFNGATPGSDGKVRYNCELKL